MVKDLVQGKTVRKSYAKIGDQIEMPNLIAVQKDSYKWFLEEGLGETLRDVSPIVSYTGNIVLEFVDYYMENNPKYDIDLAKEKDATYADRLQVKVRLINVETGEIKEQDIFMGEIPLMTPSGTFVINGAERVVVNQLVRSPGCYYLKQSDKYKDKYLYSATVMPNRGAWLEYETDAEDMFYVRVDRTRKIPVTVLIKALGIVDEHKILELFDHDERIRVTLEKDTIKTQSEALIEIYKKLRPGELPTEEAANNLFNAMFFDERRYDVTKVGRYKYNKKLSLASRIEGKIAAEKIVDKETGEVFVKEEQVITKEVAREIQDSGINEVYLKVGENKVKVIGNGTVDLKKYVKGFENVKIDVNYALLKKFMEENSKKDLPEVIKENMSELVTTHLTVEDVIASINYLLNLAYGLGSVDDIDHLGNRRIRCVGELMQNQFRVGLARLEKVIKEKMAIQDLDSIAPQTLINTKPITSVIREFFGSSQLSQFMDQTNPLTELTHKRRISALGPGGLSRDRAGFEVRDIHYTHYGRLCPIESPEGPNIGLISSLPTFAIINEYGFIETPYRKVDKNTGIVTDEIEYMTADVEEKYIIAPAYEELDEKGRFVNKKIKARFRDQILVVDSDKIDYVDISPKQLVSVAAAMIPFLENDDANRALMGANMQRQAVPLITTDSPIVGTGIEYRAAKDCGVCVVAENAGTVEKVTADEITIKTKSGIDHYVLQKFKRSNSGTCINQKPIVRKNDKIKAGDIIADGPSTDDGELALGKNILIGFMTWEGYNYEDAILINERLVKEDVFTSIHIEEYDCECRDTKLGPEEFTREIPNVGDDMLKDLDERGIIRIGAEVVPGDILVGKVTPKGETDLTAEERLLRAIFGEKARDVRDNSLRVPHGEAGTVVDVKTFSAKNGDELAPGVNEVIRVYIAKKRKISVGDKMAGRHGNKGVVSRILPEEDMPYLEDGTPLQIVLNPLGIPSRMNIGQVLEVHLGYAAKMLGWKIATPVFDGANEKDVLATLDKAGLPNTGKMKVYDGRTGEPFDNEVTVGIMYYLKLHHLVDDKIHARSTGPYSLVTQQPLGGKAQFGGQRFGEMEVWALEAYGAAYTLQEILTVKSDDTVGRVKTYEAIVKGDNVPEPGVPEAFKVLVKELQSLGLDIKVLAENNEEIELKENIDDSDDIEINTSRDTIIGDLEGEEGFNNIYDDNMETDDMIDELEDDVFSEVFDGEDDYIDNDDFNEEE